MAATVDYLFGYDATTGVVADWMYEQLTETYVLDEENRAFLEEANPGPCTAWPSDCSRPAVGVSGSNRRPTWSRR